MKDVEIRKIESLSVDERGDITSWRVDHPESILVIRRKKGTVSGNHYHKGEDIAKNPEIFFVLKGKINLKLKNIKTGEEKEMIIDGLTELTIYPYIVHKLEALEDTVFIESQKEESSYKDVYKHEL